MGFRQSEGLLSVKNGGLLNKFNQFWLWLTVSLLIMGVSILTSYQPLWANVVFNVLFPILVLIFIRTVFFEKIKLGTLILMRVLIVFAVFGILPGDIYVTIVFIFLVINILEATLTDLKKKKYFNSITGLFLAATIFTFKGTWITPNSWFGPYYTADLVTAASSSEPGYMIGIIATMAWIVAYTIWNWIFVTNEFSPSIAYLHIGILTAPLISILIFLDPGLWLIFRANSLTVGGVVQISSKPFFEERLKNRGVSRFATFVGRTDMQIFLMIFNLALISLPVILFFVYR